jgi:hypothetical protein
MSSLVASLFAFVAFVTLAGAQQHTCVYTDATGKYSLNLTDISAWTMELETADFFYYYTPCGNRMQCRQGNADFHANTAQYKQGINACAYYLSVDHHTPATYSFGGASWRFHFEDGEECQQLNAPRQSTIYYHCNEEQHTPATFYNIEEYSLCHYIFNIHSPLACIPENQFNANCQWKITDPNSKDVYQLDLSTLKGEVMHIRNNNGYSTYFSPCQNGLNCYQQTHHMVQATIENHATGTCDHYMSIWEDGRVQPFYHANGDDSYFAFYYFNGEKCSNGDDGIQEVNYICDPTATPYKVINETSSKYCYWTINVATSLACQATDDITIEAKLAW